MRISELAFTREKPVKKKDTNQFYLLVLLLDSPHPLFC